MTRDDENCPYCGAPLTWVYQNGWMHKHGIPPVPVWLVDWFDFLNPYERWKAKRRRRQDKDEGEIPF